ncbi:MAG: PDZ domain-containing protein [Candidatus Magnetomorum sp.]|nr:PDZ domain-containing protein [Candidatus Magnetomorum sp.]
MKTYRPWIIVLIFMMVILTKLSIFADSTIESQVSNGYLKKTDQRTLESEKAFLGVYLNPVADLVSYGEKYKGKKGLLIPVVLYQSAAEQAGIQPEDVIFLYDSINFDSIKKSKLVETFKNYIRDEKKIHDPLILHILRKKQFYAGKKQTEDIPQTLYHPDVLSKQIEDQLPGETLALTIHKEVQSLTITAILGRRPHMRDSAPPDNADLFPEYDQQSNSDIQCIDDLIHQYQLNDAYNDLMQRLSDDEWWDDGFRTRFFRFAHRDPKKFPLMAENLTQKFATTVFDGGIRAIDLNIAAANLMDVSDMSFDIKSIESLALACDRAITDCIDELINYHQRLQALHQQAFSQLSPSDLQLLEEQTPLIMKRFVDHYYLDIGADIQEMEHHRKVSALAQNIHYNDLYRASCLLQNLSHPTFLKALQKLRKKGPFFFDEPPKTVGISGDVWCIKKIEKGYLVIGGPGYTRYTRPLDWIIDMGGDDLYLNNAGAATPEKKISVVIDLSGNDHYSSTEQWSQGAGFMGFGIVLDCSGNDFYTAKSLSQGCGVMGVGHLIDLSGNDQYHSQELQQGVAFWGFGSLIDTGGDDSYYGSLFAQAVGGTYGLGLLVDTSGNDRYFATGKHKSSYETDGVFRGSSQGFGIGFRGIASGGIGMLLDLDGSDQFVAGNFSQGGGYFFGMGILKNAGNQSDLYIASRYGQGFSAHSAAGILIDDGGDDIYKGIQGGVQSAAWDLGIAALIDRSGNDQYHAGFTFFSQGAAAHNGFSIFLDMSGMDQYLSDSGGIAKAQSNDYHNGNSLGFFIDKGGQMDVYETEALNNHGYLNGEYSIFLDSK